MIEEICRNLEEKKEVRANLISLKEQLKEKDCKGAVRQWEMNCRTVQSFLMHEDAKTRKNAAQILGQLALPDTAEALFAAYEREDKLFVRSAYLQALGAFDCRAYSGRLRERYAQLCATPVGEEEKKHIREEIKALEKLLHKLDGGKKHKFTGYDKEYEMILTTHPNFREVTLSQLGGRKSSVISLGVKVKTSAIREILEIRTFREILFLTNAKKHIEPDPQAVADALFESDLTEMLGAMHEGEWPFYFRIELKGGDAGNRGDFIRRMASCIEEKFERKLINSTDSYEIEIRLLVNKDKTLFPCLKLYTIPMRRFSYRKCASALSMHPVTAALLMRLAAPYLKEGAQVLDPFCGVGTLLIERDFLVPAGDMYGVDSFGEAILGARENARAAGMNINYINRDIFDFTHKYLFDEIVTDMPVRGKRTKEEQDQFYGRFFEKAASLLREQGVIVMYSGENGFVKKYLRLRKDFYLKKEYCIREKEGYYLFIIYFKG